MNPLTRLAIVVAESSTQHFVAANQFVQGPLQHGDIQPPLEQQRIGDVVERIARLQLVEKPQLSLGKRQRQGCRAGCAWGNALIGGQPLDQD